MVDKRTIIFPAPGEIILPVVRPLPLIPPGAGYADRLRAWILERPTYQLVEDYAVYSQKVGGWIVVPRGFITDFASIPRFFGFLLTPNNILAFPAVPHDFGYRFGVLIVVTKEGETAEIRGVDRKFVDDVFLELADQANGFRILNRICYQAIRMFAGNSYGRDCLEDSGLWTG